jgi:hypothetical protein
MISFNDEYIESEEYKGILSNRYLLFSYSIHAITPFSTLHHRMKSFTLAALLSSTATVVAHAATTAVTIDGIK